jgi:formylglycine-generating enzyme required for sulfatase activity
MSRGVLACLAASALIGLAALPERGRPEAPRGDKVVTNSIGMKLVRVPAGKFRMGSPAGEKERDPIELQHEVTIGKPFYLGAYEVTQREYHKVMGEEKPWQRSFFDEKRGGGPDHPRENVRWSQAVEFCKRLSARPEEKKAGRAYRLPTEAEWEYACRADTTTAFHGGASLSSGQANFNGGYPFGGAARGPYLRRTAKVGSYQPNAWGLYDMHGNVAEWCSDWYDPNYYKGSPKVDPPGPAKGVLSTGYDAWPKPEIQFYRVIRGGCWLDEARACRSAYRFRAMPQEPYRLIGFRVACDVGAKRP